MPERYGIYFAPAVTSPLWAAATQWLGRDAASGATSQITIGGIDAGRRAGLTAAARRYGFHATLKAPMALAQGLGGRDLDRALKAFAAVHPAVDLGPLAVQPIGGFLALMPVAQSAATTDFAARCTVDFDGFRAPPADDDRARRIAAGALTPRQVELLDRYGYPYVLEQFLFHMTLTDSLGPADHEALHAAATAWFAPAIGEHLLLDRIALFHEAEPGAPFTRLRDYPLGGEEAG